MGDVVYLEMRPWCAALLSSDSVPRQILMDGELLAVG